MPTIIEELAIALGYAVDDKPLTEHEKKAKAAADRVSASWSKIGDAAAKAGAAAVVAIGGLVALAAKSAAAGAAIDDAAKRSGAGTKDIQRLGYAAEQSGGSTEGLIVSLKFLSKSLVDARTGTGPAADALKKLGISLADIDGKTAEQQFAVFADAFSKLHDDALKTDLALTIFGKAGGELIPMLDEGAAGVKKLGDELTNMGGVLSDDAIAKAAEFDDQLGAMKKELGAVVNEIGIELIPILQSGAKEWGSWVIVVGGVATAIGGLKLVALAHDIGLVGTSLAAVKWSAGIAGALALGVALGTALDQAFKLSEALAGIESHGKRGPTTRGAPSSLGDLSAADKFALAANTRIRDEAQAALDDVGFGAPGYLTDPIRRDRDNAQAQIDAVNKRGASTRKQRQSTDRAWDWASNLEAPDIGAAAGAVGERIRVFGAQTAGAVTDTTSGVFKPGKKKKGAGAGADKKAERELAEALVALHVTGIDDELQTIGVRAGASEKAIRAAVESAARSLMAGDSKQKAKSSGIGSLSGSQGFDVAKRQTDPTLRALFGEDTLPDVPLSDLERGQQPQVLIATINNSYTVAVNNTIDGTREPAVVAEAVGETVRGILRDEVSKVSRFSKVLFDR